MKYLDGTEYKWKIPEKVSKHPRRKTSKQHQRAYNILSSIYPTTPIYEEVPIQINKNKQLYLDFYISSLGIAVEVHGEQHYKYNSFFYKSKLDFYSKLKNDNDKAEWCEINNIKLIILPYNLSDEEWKKLIDS